MRQNNKKKDTCKSSDETTVAEKKEVAWEENKGREGEKERESTAGMQE